MGHETVRLSEITPSARWDLSEVRQKFPYKRVIPPARDIIFLAEFRHSILQDVRNKLNMSKLRQKLH